ncbi:MAG: flagellar biosynthesis protein FlgE [Pseudomonadales bacterium]|nr:flagellar biosynthesis protein FlgE [Pseudomonadales bacterium]
MASITATQTGITGVQNGLEQAQRAALEIARVGTTGGEQKSELADLTAASVDLLEAQNQVQASAKVLNTAQDTLGTIIDTIA